MSEKIVQLNEEIIKGQLRELVRGSVEETLNELLEKEEESLTQAARYERNEDRQGYRNGQGGRYPYVYVDGIYLRRNWGGEYENVAILVAIAVNEDGFREVLGAAEGMKEDKASWVSFFQWLRGRSLDGVKLIVGDKCMGMLEAVGEVFPDAKYQRCVVHFYRNVFSVVPKSKVKIVAKMLKSKSVFPTDDSLLKMLYLAMMDITKKWTGRRQDWSMIHAQLAVFFADRMPD